MRAQDKRKIQHIERFHSRLYVVSLTYSNVKHS